MCGVCVCVLRVDTLNLNQNTAAGGGAFKNTSDLKSVCNTVTSMQSAAKTPVNYAPKHQQLVNSEKRSALFKITLAGKPF